VRFRAVMMVTSGCCIVVVMLSMNVVRSWRRDARAERDGQRPAFARQHETHGHEGAQQHERQQPDDPGFEAGSSHRAAQYSSRASTTLRPVSSHIYELRFSAYVTRRGAAIGGSLQIRTQHKERKVEP